MRRRLMGVDIEEDNMIVSKIPATVQNAGRISFELLDTQPYRVYVLIPDNAENLQCISITTAQNNMNYNWCMKDTANVKMDNNYALQSRVYAIPVDGAEKITEFTCYEFGG